MKLYIIITAMYFLTNIPCVIFILIMFILHIIITKKLFGSNITGSWKWESGKRVKKLARTEDCVVAVGIVF